MLFSKSSDFKRIILKRIKLKKKRFKYSNKIKYKNNPLIDNTSRFLTTIISNRKIVKFIFFKKFTKQKKLTKFIINISKKNNFFSSRLSNFLFTILIQCQFFFFINDINFFLKNKFITVNNNIVTNKFFELNLGDSIKLVCFNSYFDYISKIFKFFKKKISKLKYKRWKNFKLRGKSSIFKHWEPDFLNKFLFYRICIPKYLEVDFFSLSVVYLYNEKNIIFKNKIFYIFLSFYMLKTYNWKKIN